jgi:hypothetical protein
VDRYNQVCGKAQDAPSLAIANGKQHPKAQEKHHIEFRAFITHIRRRKGGANGEPI